MQGHFLRYESGFANPYYNLDHTSCTVWADHHNVAQNETQVMSQYLSFLKMTSIEEISRLLWLIHFVLVAQTFASTTE